MRFESGGERYLQRTSIFLRQVVGNELFVVEALLYGECAFQNDLQNNQKKNRIVCVRVIFVGDVHTSMTFGYKQVDCSIAE